MILIRGGTVVNHDHSLRADILVDGGTIAAVGPALDVPTGAEVIPTNAACRHRFLIGFSRTYGAGVD